MLGSLTAARSTQPFARAAFENLADDWCFGVSSEWPTSRATSKVAAAKSRFVVARSVLRWMVGQTHSGEREQIVGPERSKVVFRSRDLNAWFVDRRPVNSTVNHRRYLKTGKSNSRLRLVEVATIARD